MILDFVQIIEKRKQILHDRIKLLDEALASLKISEAIPFEISEIDVAYPKKKGAKVGVKQLSKLEDVKGPVVYIFEMQDNTMNPDIITNLAKFRSKENVDELGKSLRRSTAQLPKNAYENNTNILYVGSIKERIHCRVRQHLGLGHIETFAMQLKHWAPQNLKLNFYYIQVSNTELTYDLEAAIALKLKPLIGKTEK